jgi:hypothetical protein
MMNAKDLKAIVDDYPRWRGNSYALATIIAEAQRDETLQKIEEAGQQELADQIRSQP